MIKETLQDSKFRDLVYGAGLISSRIGSRFGIKFRISLQAANVIR